jgi:hypothetical protein
MASSRTEFIDIVDEEWLKEKLLPDGEALTILSISTSKSLDAQRYPMRRKARWRGSCSL